MPRKSITALNPHTEGPLVTKLDEHDTALDAAETALDEVEADLVADIISRQTLGAHAQTIEIAVDGDADECVEVDLWGQPNASGSIIFKLTVGGVATAVTMSTQQWTAAAAVVIVTTYSGFAYAADGTGLRATFFLARHSAAKRGGYSECVALNAGVIQRLKSAFNLANSADNVTKITIEGSAANQFGSGMKVIARRRKLSA